MSRKILPILASDKADRGSNSIAPGNDTAAQKNQAATQQSNEAALMRKIAEQAAARGGGGNVALLLREMEQQGKLTQEDQKEIGTYRTQNNNRGIAAPKVTTSGGYYSRPTLWERSEQLYDYAASLEPAYTEKRNALETVLSGLEQAQSDLEFWERHIQSLAAAYNSNPSERYADLYNRARNSYDQFYDAYSSTYDAYKNAYDDYAYTEHQYANAVKAYQNYTQDQQAAFDYWRGTIRDAAAIEEELSGLKDQIQKLEGLETLAKAGAFLGKAAQGVAGSSSGLIANDLQQTGGASEELGRLRQLRDLLQEELDWSRYAGFADLQDAAYFGAMSADDRLMELDMMELQTWPEEDVAMLETYIVQSDNEFWDMSKADKLQTMDNARVNANALFEKYGAAKVNEIAESYRRHLNQRNAAELTQMAQNAADKHEALHSALSVGANLANSISSPLGYLQELGNRTGRYSSLDPDNVGNMFGKYAGAVRGQVSKNISGDKYDEYGNKISDGGLVRQGLAEVYGAGMSAADSLARIFAGGGSKVISLGLAATGSFGQTVSRMSEQGANPYQAITMGVIDGALEILTEKYSIDNLFNMASSGKQGIKQILKNMLIQGGVEVWEEELSFLGSTLAEAVVMREKAAYKQRIQELMAQGQTREQAKEVADSELWLEAGQTALQSFLSGSMMSGVSSAYSNTVSRRQSDAAQKTTQQEQRSGQDVTAQRQIPKENVIPSAAHAENTEESEQDQGQAPGGAAEQAIREENTADDAAEPEGIRLRAVDEEGDSGEVSAKELLSQAKEDLKSGKITDEQFDAILDDVMHLEELEDGTSVKTFDTQSGGNAQNDIINAYSNGGTNNDNSQQRPAGSAAAQSAGGNAVPGGTDLLHGGSQRYDGTGTPEQDGSLAGRAGQASAGDQAGAHSGRAEVHRRYSYKDLRTERLTSKQLGLTDGTDYPNNRTIPTEMWDESMSAKAEQVLQQTGKRVVFITGRLQFRGSGGQILFAKGAITEDKIIVQADHTDYSAEQIADHEGYHGLQRRFDHLTADIVEHIRQRFTSGEFEEVLGTYIDQLYGVYKLDEVRSQEEYIAVQDAIMEEVIADARAGMNMWSAGATQFTQTVNEFLEEKGITGKQEQENGTEQPTGPPNDDRYSIETLPDGKKYVRADRQVIFGNDPESWSEQVEDYINGRIRRGQDVTLVAENGDVLTITADTAGKLADNHTGRGETMPDEDFYVKSNAAVHIDELSQISERGQMKKDLGSRHGNFASGGWNYRTAYFQDFDGRYYRLQISVAQNENGNVVYNIGRIEERSSPTVYGSSAKGGALGGKTSFEKSVPQARTAVKDRYSYAGENANNADLDALERAKQMRSAGVADETIRQQTGWHMGMDGKWRWEIDDSGMRYDSSGDIRGAESAKWAMEDYESAREDLWGHADMGTLEKVRAYNRADIAGDEATKQALYDELVGGQHAYYFSQYVKAMTRAKSARNAPAGGTLQDYIDHPALFEAYPQLRNVTLRFERMGGGNMGYFSRTDNEIVLNAELRYAAEDTLVHEIQHAIQKAEGFARGSNEEYWQRRQDSEDPVKAYDTKIRDSEKQVNEIMRQLPENVAEQFREWSAMDDSTPEAMALMDELSDGPYGDLFEDYFMLTWGLNDMRRTNYKRGPRDLYRNTAGEIEARDTASRRNLTAEERRGQKPAQGDSNTVFVEDFDELSFAEMDAEYGPQLQSYFDPNISAEEIDGNIRQVAQMDPVSGISGQEFAKGETDLVTQVDAFFSQHGNTAFNPQLGDVVLDRRGIKDDIAHGIGRKKAAAFAAVPDVIERGLVVDFQRDWKGRGYDTAVVAAPITIGTEEHIAAIVLTRSNQTNRFYVHEVLTTENGASPFKTGARKGDPGGNTPSVFSILDRIRSVKNQGRGGDRFSVDDSGSLEEIENRYKNQTDYLFLHENANTVTIDNMVVKKNLRNQGIGTRILNDVISYADAAGKTIALTPTSEFGTKQRLTKWYKANGFVENKGRNTDFSLRDTMYRLPRSAGTRYSVDDSDIRYSVDDADDQAAIGDLQAELYQLQHQRRSLLEADTAYAAAADNLRYANTFTEKVAARKAMAAAAVNIDTAAIDQRISDLNERISEIRNRETRQHREDQEKYSGTKTAGYSTMPDTRLKDLDRDYMKAVRSGDRARMAELVEQAAEAAMPASVVRDKSGRLLKTYHHTGSRFTVFDRNMARTGTEMDGFFFAPDPDSTSEYGSNVITAYLNITKLAMDPKLDRKFNDSGTLLREKLAYQGYDGMARTENGEIYEYMTFDPEQIKSADPVVYDDRGQVVPLSERFNFHNPDIRYSVDEADISDTNGLRENMTTKERAILRGVETRLLRDIGRALGVTKFGDRNYLKSVIQGLSDAYLESGTIDQRTMDDLFEQAFRQGIVVDRELHDQYEEVHKYLRTVSITLDPTDRSNIADYPDFVKRMRGKVRIVNEGGLPVDSAWHELNNMAPELFPDSIAHPADQLVRMTEVMGSLQIAEKSLGDYYGPMAGTYKKDAKAEFERTVWDSVGELRQIRRYEQERQQKIQEAEPAPTTPEEAMEAWTKLKAARKTYEKAAAKNLLTDEDEMAVGELLKGKILPEHLDKDKLNVKGILAVYEAKQEYEQLVKLLAEYRRKVKAGLRSEADTYLETANAWKDKNIGLLYSRETMQRNVEDIVPDKKLAKRINERYFETIRDAEAAAVKMKEEYRKKVRNLKLSRKVQKGDLVSEAHAVQLYGEAMDNIRILEKARGRLKQRDGKSLEEWRGVVYKLWQENPGLDKVKIENAVTQMRQIYDELFQKMNEVRVRWGYEPVNYRQGYFPHFQPGNGDGIMAQFGRVLGIDTQVVALPTTINGLTHTFKPGIQWFGNAQERLGFNTAYDAVEGFDCYIEGVASVICQTENIQRLRTLASQIRYRTTDEGIRKQVDAIYSNPTLTEEQKNDAISGIYEKGRYTLSNFVVEVDEYTNLLANKKSKLDRTVEALIGRKFYTSMKWLESRVGANMIAGNLTSALTNIIPLTQAGAQLSKKELLRGMGKTLAAIWKDDGIVGRSSFLTNRRGSDPLVKVWSAKASEVLSKPMELIDRFASGSIVRAAYYQNLKRGLSESEAMHQADIFASRVMAERSKGGMPTLFESKNPFFKLFTQFQLEVNNQWSEVFKDIPRSQREKGLGALALVLLQYFLGAWLFNNLYEKWIGRRPAMDPIDIVLDAAKDFASDDVSTTDALENLFNNVLEELPFSSALTLVGIETDGGRIPVSSGIPNIPTLVTAATNDEWAPEKRWKEAQDELNKLAYVLPPFGGNQISKIWKGVKAYIEGGSYSVDAAGNDILQYPVYNDESGDFWGLVQAMILGKSALPEAREWVEDGFDSLSARQTAAYQDMLATGVKGREAFNLLMELQGAEETNGKTRIAVQRDILRNSDISGDGKAIAYYGLILSDAAENERALMDRLAEAGADVGEVANVLMDIHDADSLHGAEASCAKRNAIINSALTEEEKIAIYREKISESRDEDIEAFRAVGLDFNEFLRVQNQYATVNGKDANATAKATDLSRWVDDRDYTDNQAAIIKDCFVYYNQIPASASRYDKFVDAGMDVDDAYDLTGALNELQPEEGAEQVSDLQKWRISVDFSDDVDDQLTALSAVMTDAQFLKVEIANDFGVSPDAYVTLQEIKSRYDSDGNRSYTNAEIRAAVDGLPGYYTTEQKAVLWQLVTGSTSAKNNPYSRQVGQQVLDAKAAANEAAAQEEELEGLTLGSW